MPCLGRRNSPLGRSRLMSEKIEIRSVEMVRQIRDENAEFIVRKLLNRREFDLKRAFDALRDEFKPSFKGKRIFPQMMPMSERMTRVLRPEIYQGKENGSKIERNDPCPCGSGK